MVSQSDEVTSSTIIKGGKDGKAGTQPVQLELKEWKTIISSSCGCLAVHRSVGLDKNNQPIDPDEVTSSTSLKTMMHFTS